MTDWRYCFDLCLPPYCGPLDDVALCNGLWGVVEAWSGLSVKLMTIDGWQLDVDRTDWHEDDGFCLSGKCHGDPRSGTS